MFSWGKQKCILHSMVLGVMCTWAENPNYKLIFPKNFFNQTICIGQRKQGNRKEFT